VHFQELPEVLIELQKSVSQTPYLPAVFAFTGKEVGGRLMEATTPVAVGNQGEPDSTTCTGYVHDADLSKNKTYKIAAIPRQATAGDVKAWYATIVNKETGTMCMVSTTDGSILYDNTEVGALCGELDGIFYVTISIAEEEEEHVWSPEVVKNSSSPAPPVGKGDVTTSAATDELELDEALKAAGTDFETMAPPVAFDTSYSPSGPPTLVDMRNIWEPINSGVRNTFLPSALLEDDEAPGFEARLRSDAPKKGRRGGAAGQQRGDRGTLSSNARTTGTARAIAAAATARKPDNMRTKMCRDGLHCKFGKSCWFAHTKEELIGDGEEDLPTNWKTKMCFNVRSCKFGQDCWFAHSEQELRIEVMPATEFSQAIPDF